VAFATASLRVSVRLVLNEFNGVFSRVVTYAMGRLEGVADIAWVSVRPHHGQVVKETEERRDPALLAEQFRSARLMKRRADIASACFTAHRTPVP
jgi:hypothetical protein